MSAAHEKLNADWLSAWSDKDVEKLVAFYTSDMIYKDPNTAQGLNGHDELRAYLTGMFAATAKMIYTPDEIWPTEAGFCGRWYCKIGERGEAGTLRGFDLVILRNGLICHNEVYLHELDAAK